MASSPPVSISSAQSSSHIRRLRWDFYTFFRVEYPESDRARTVLGGARKTQGRREYVCLHCPVRWSNRYPNNAITHAQNRHRRLVQDSEASQTSLASTRASMDSFVAFRPSDSSLGNAFNAQQYSEAIVGLLTPTANPILCSYLG